MKQKVQSLYQEVFGRLRDENGGPTAQSVRGPVRRGRQRPPPIPRTLADQQARRQERKPKDRESEPGEEGG